MNYQQELKTLRLKNLSLFNRELEEERNQIREYNEKFKRISRIIDEDINRIIKGLSENNPELAKELTDFKEELKETSNCVIMDKLNGKKTEMNAELDDQFFLFPGL